MTCADHMMLLRKIRAWQLIEDNRRKSEADPEMPQRWLDETVEDAERAGEQLLGWLYDAPLAGIDPEPPRCPRCDGSGEVRHPLWGSRDCPREEATCPECGGSGLR